MSIEEIQRLVAEEKDLPGKIEKAQKAIKAAQSETEKNKGQSTLSELEKRKEAIPRAIAALQGEAKLAGNRATFTRQ